MTCVFPDVLDNLTGSDANYEMVTSSTLAKLRLVWSGATKLLVYIFFHSELQGFSVCTDKEGKSAQFIAEEAKDDFISLFKSLGEDFEVKIMPDYTKEQIVEEVHEIKTQTDQITAADGPCVGIFMVHIGFSVPEENVAV